jgi:hypothetical protein
MLIHATVTITGDKPLLGVCESRMRQLLSAQFLKGEATEHHGPAGLCYDLKVEGGIPFPVFAQASQEFPSLEFAAEWVNVERGEKGGARIVNGRVTGQENARITTRGGDDHPAHVEVAPDGRLTLALTLLRVSREEWRGYGLTAARDAVLRVMRHPGSDAVELFATEGGPEWAVRWQGALSSRTFFRGELRPPVAIDEADFRELDGLAHRFVADWIWFGQDPAEDIAVEVERFRLYGYEPSAANVRSLKLHSMRAEAAEGQPLVHASLGHEDQWVKDFVLATWAKDE